MKTKKKQLVKRVFEILQTISLRALNAFHLERDFVFYIFSAIPKDLRVPRIKVLSTKRKGISISLNTAKSRSSALVIPSP